MLISGVFGFLGESIAEAIAGLFLLIDSLIYTLIGWFYEIFLILASFRLFDSDMYKNITDAVYSIIGVVALFLFAYELLNLMVNVDKEKSGTVIKKFIVKLITSMMMLILVPTAFNFAFDVQNSFLSNNVLGKLLLPRNSTDDELEDFINNSQSDSELDVSIEKLTPQQINYYTIKYYGNSMAVQVFQAFFFPSNMNPKGQENDVEYKSLEERFEDASKDIKRKGDLGSYVKDKCKFWNLFGPGTALVCGGINLFQYSELPEILRSSYSLHDAYAIARTTGNFSIFQPFVDNIVGDETSITYLYLISTIAGIAVCYILLLYCIDLAVRSFKLAFYEIIAPLPIFMRVIPKQEKVFDNWWKAVLSCFVEVFTRMFILYLGVFFITYLPAILGKMFSIGSTPYRENIILYLLVRCFIIVGLFIFIKQLPSIIEKATGIKSGNFSLNLLDHIKDAAWAPAAVGGLIAGKGNPLAMFRAGANGWKNNNLKGIGSEVTRRRLAQENKEKGSTFGGRTRERLRNTLGLETGIEKMDRNIKEGIDPRTGRPIEAVNDTLNRIVIRDANGIEIRGIEVGEVVGLDMRTQEELETTKKVNAQTISAINEDIKHITDSQQSNQQIIDAFSAIKKEAKEKIAEEKSTIEETITTSFGSFRGNLASMREYLKNAQAYGATKEQINEIVKAIGQKEDEMWRTFARNQIADGDNKISNLSDQILLWEQQGALYSSPGVVSTEIINGTGLDRLEALDINAKNFNNTMTLEKQSLDNDKSHVQEQNNAIDRVTAQLNEVQELTKRSTIYVSTAADVDAIKNQGGTNNK